MPTLSLTKNCRNTPYIGALATTLGGLNPPYSAFLRPDDGASYRLQYYREDPEQVRQLLSSIDVLKTEGWNEREITVLSFSSESACIASKVRPHEWRGQLKPIWDESPGGVRYTSIRRFKGLESPCVILTDVTSLDDDISRDLMYIGVTRAQTRLIVLCSLAAKRGRSGHRDGGSRCLRDRMVEQQAGRDELIQALSSELVGPDPRGDELTIINDTAVLLDARSAFRPWREKDTGQEILTHDLPGRRYGVGVLYPPLSQVVDAADPDDAPRGDPTGDNADSEDGQDAARATPVADLDAIARRRASDTTGSDDFDVPALASANSYRPSALGLTAFIEASTGLDVEIAISAGRYRPIKVSIPLQRSDGYREVTWWLRSGVHGRCILRGRDLLACDSPRVLALPVDLSGAEELDLGVEAFVRPWTAERPKAGLRRFLITVSFVNRTPDCGAGSATRQSTASVFQSQLRLQALEAGVTKPAFLPYPRVPGERLDEEEEEIELLYRHMLTFAVGHGCAADWEASWGAERVAVIRSSCLPVAETPSVTPEVPAQTGGADGTLMVSIAGLAGIGPKQGDELEELRALLAAYSTWVEALAQEPVAERYQRAAVCNRARLDDAICRMESGLRRLEQSKEDGGVEWEAFTLANRAMLLQQLRSASRRPRTASYDADANLWTWDEPIESIDMRDVPAGRGYWRPFQIAFLLLAIESAASSDHRDRDLVDLIWFPTGGGKTEAYLGLAAFSMFLRRLRAVRAGSGEDSGVEVLMRYTLRLLTAQQFQRAAALMCAMEFIRRRAEPSLGRVPFALGLWVGGTPNRRDQARAALTKLRREEHPEHNIVVLERCPWCRAQMGPVSKRPDADRRSRARRRRRRAGDSDRQERVEVRGYEFGTVLGGSATSVVARCPDPACDFSSELPVLFIDEDIYDPAVSPPSMVIGTVDKFAMLAWRPEARRIFGLGADGARTSTPPGLVLQDELHLIAGPLGSMVGLYETVLEALLSEGRRKPKIVASTATIRGYRQQVRALFGRDRVALFPPPGLSADDSFFARFARDPRTGELEPGRKYVGVFAPGLGSSQTVQVRTFSSLLQATHELRPTARDPWWTLMAFYNSLRELGGGLTLFYSDIPDYLRGSIAVRSGRSLGELRRLRRIKELTGRLDNREVVSVIGDLEVSVGKAGAVAVDTCLASNIIEVGVDIDRLSLLAVVGQPKSTASYIQVTGRVGRRWWERPGLVVVLYGASKPRDRSHYEQFRTYHSQLYAQVEPSSVTPFSRPALDRALHGVLASWVRQTEESRAPPDEIGDTSWEAFRRLLLTRVAAAVGPDGEQELADVRRVLDARLREWRAWRPTRWEGEGPELDIPLLRWPRPVRGRASCCTVVVNPDLHAKRRPRVQSSHHEPLRALRRGGGGLVDRIRRSQLIVPFGVGAMTALKDGTTVVVAGLDHWFQGVRERSRLEMSDFRIDEPRLTNSLGVSALYLPPDYRRIRRVRGQVQGPPEPNIGLSVPVLKFPQFHVCRWGTCRRLVKLPLHDENKSWTSFCPEDETRVHRLDQVRFVAVCSRGHLQDFPWAEWVHRSASPSCSGKLRLDIRSGASLSAIHVKCETCGAKRNLAGVMSHSGEESFLSTRLSSGRASPFLCRGLRPWLGEHEGEGCDRPLVATLRGALHLHFSRTRSAIHLPIQSADEACPDALVDLIERTRECDPGYRQLDDSLRQAHVDTAVRVQSVRSSSMQHQLYDASGEPFADVQISAALSAVDAGIHVFVPAERGGRAAAPHSEVSFRHEEYTVLCDDLDRDLLSVRTVPGSRYGEEVRSRPLGDFVRQVSLVSRLRETRAYYGFTRLDPNESTSVDESKAMLRRRDCEDDWLPAYAVFGEGIFIVLDLTMVSAWEERVQGAVRDHLSVMKHRLDELVTSRRAAPRPALARYVLVHSLAHSLINRLVFSCGYSSASLRERLYVSDDVDASMAALMIYTAAGDSEGTLGGLVRMGEPGRLEPVFRRALERAEWCSLDPVCTETGTHAGQGPDSCNIAACHSCALLPETSCENFNRLLDRGVLVGTPERPELAFFR